MIVDGNGNLDLLSQGEPWHRPWLALCVPRAAHQAAPILDRPRRSATHERSVGKRSLVGLAKRHGPAPNRYAAVGEVSVGDGGAVVQLKS